MVGGAQADQFSELVSLGLKDRILITHI